MFFAESVPVELPVPVVRHRLEAWLDGGHLTSAANDATGSGSRLLIRAGFGPITKSVAAERLPAYRRGPAVIIPIRWIATGPLGALYPALDANLEIHPAGDGATLHFIGAYEPPLGNLGVALDTVLLSRAGRLTARRFVRRLGRRVREAEPELSAPAPAGPAPDGPAPAGPAPVRPAPDGRAPAAERYRLAVRRPLPDPGD